MTTVRRALVSVHDKAGVVEFARGLAGLGIEVVSTGGTARLLREAGVPVREVAELTGSPEILGGRVKTLHPKVHGGILARRGLASDRADLERHGIGPIDLVAVNLYPFEAAVARPGISEAEAIEEIDIGGVTLLRAAAKNHADVVVVCEPADYGPVLAELRAKGGDTARETRWALAWKAFLKTAAYDAAIGGWLMFSGKTDGPGMPPVLRLAASKVADLKYGENPHQVAALYRDLSPERGVAGAKRLAGPELSYNNCWDVAGALRCVGDLAEPAVVIVKHATPCGVARGADLADAVRRAIACDPISAFGGVVALNRPVDVAVAEALAAKGNFFEVIAAPAVAPDALARLTGRASWGDRVRLLETDPCQPRAGARLVRSLPGGFLVQTDDAGPADAPPWRTVTKRAPTDAETRDLAFAWTVVKHVASNAIVLVAGDATVGIGGGQTNRVDAVRGAVARAGERARGAVLASDAFFPFPDSLEVAAAAGVRAAIQPGGSKKDAESIAAADAAGMAMVITGVRHFRH